MKRFFGLLFVFFMFAQSVGVSEEPKKEPVKSETAQKSGEAVVSKSAPWFAAWDMNDKVINSKNIFSPKTRRVVLVFFATYCKPCIAGLKIIAENREKFEAANIRIVLVNYMEEKAVVQEFLQKHNLESFSVLWDKFGKVSEKFGVLNTGENGVVGSLPKTVVIEKDGKVARIIGKEGEDYVDLIVK